ncbi:MAG: enoyl-CoA hydratase/isomerase family protein, partial [Pseudomonadota bacterium]
MSTISLAIENNLAILTLDNPSKLNALTMGMLDDLSAHLDTIDARSEIRGIILTGAGARAFCCGADIAEWGPMPPAEFARHWVRRGHRVFDRLARLHLPSIAALNGHAFGGGLELACACDLRVMA